ncbi:MAG: 1-pyrroline-5-carboxylate dehydrogenase, partial [Rhodoglobus sp.]
DRDVASVIKRAQAGISFDEFEEVQRAALSDERAWQAGNGGCAFGASVDVSGLVVERNVLRYRPVNVAVRLSEGARLGDLVRLLAAASRARSTVSISSALPLPVALVESFTEPLPPLLVSSVTIESDAAWLVRAASEAVAGGLGAGRIRLVSPRGSVTARGTSPNATALAAALNGNPDIAIYGGEVTTSGRVELMPFLHEQAVSMTAHRFGNPDPAMESLVI